MYDARASACSRLRPLGPCTDPRQHSPAQIATCHKDPHLRQVGTEHVLLGLIMEATAAATRRAKAAAEPSESEPANPGGHLSLGITPEVQPDVRCRIPRLHDKPCITAVCTCIGVWQNTWARISMTRWPSLSTSECAPEHLEVRSQSIRLTTSSICRPPMRPMPGSAAVGAVPRAADRVPRSLCLVPPPSAPSNPPSRYVDR